MNNTQAPKIRHQQLPAHPTTHQLLYQMEHCLTDLYLAVGGPVWRHQSCSCESSPLRACQYCRLYYTTKHLHAIHDQLRKRLNGNAWVACVGMIIYTVVIVLLTLLCSSI